MRVEDLERELRAERPEPEPEFARQLDDWAAAGFPRDRGLGPQAAGRRGAAAGGVLRRAWKRLSSVPPRRVLAPAGSLAVMLVVIGVAISQSGELGSDDEGSLSEQEGTVSQQAPGDAASSNQDSDGFLGAPDEGVASTEKERESAAGVAAPNADELVAPPPDQSGGGIARGTEERIQDTSARITLGAEADEVQGVANEVVEVTDRHDGIVLDSQVTSDQGGARAAFTLEIPYTELDAALTDLSGLGDVISRTQTAEDITARAVRARKDLAEVLDRVREARVELIRADTREERLIVTSRINSLQATADALEMQLNDVQRQGRFATVEVEITSNGPSSDDEDWTLGDALDDAGRVIEVIGGVALISLAVLVPLGLVAALAWLIGARVLRRQRERALDR